MRHALVITALMVFSWSAAAEPNVEVEQNVWGDFVKSYPLASNKVRVLVNDEVTDGCLPSPSKIKSAASRRLGQNRYTVLDEFQDSNVVIDLMGYAVMEDVCVVYVSVEILTVVVGLPVGLYKITSNNSEVDFEGISTKHAQNIPIDRTMLAAKKSEIQSKVGNQVLEFMDDLLIKAVRASAAVKKLEENL